MYCVETSTLVGQLWSISDLSPLDASSIIRRNFPAEFGEIALSLERLSSQTGSRGIVLAPELVDQVLTLTVNHPLHAYIVVSLLTGGRAEELRALQWSNVHPEESRTNDRIVPPHIEVWRSVRSTGDTKARKSRRTLAVPMRCVDILRRHRAQQDHMRLAAGTAWH